LNRPLGIFDSGIGGLTVLKEIQRRIPCEDVVYFGDTAHLPYGTKSKETITKFSIDNVKFLQGFQAKMVVVACNTASSLSLDVLKKKFSIPIIGVIEPGAREAARKTRNGRIGVIGTKATIGSAAYETCLKRTDSKLKVYSASCPLFVPLVEEGWLEGEVVNQIAHFYLDSLVSFGIDTLILGCTHYPLLEKIIQKIVGKDVTLINSAEETAKEAKILLEKLKNTGSKEKTNSGVQFYVSDEPEQFRVLGERFLGRPITSVAKVADYV
jgi:glutamate racemase